MKREIISRLVTGVLPDLFQRRAHIAGIRDVVSLENVLCLVAGNRHSHSAGYPGANQIPDGRAAQIVNGQASAKPARHRAQPSSHTRLVPRNAKICRVEYWPSIRSESLSKERGDLLQSRPG